MSETTYDAAETTTDRTTLCPFCQLPAARIVAEDELAVVIRDAFPVSAGHTIIVPRRHVRSFFEATDTERASLLRLLDEAKVTLDAEHQPDAYNIGINDGVAAGQTVPHMHIHLIPRYVGDRLDPRGGVRWVLPEKAKYWP
jgi:diadenosine tetraphosphate (Ap4A) HIT family hydrolase